MLENGGVIDTRLNPLRGDYHFATAVFDQLALILARRYRDGGLDFEMADWLANTFESELTCLFLEDWPASDVGTWPFLWEEFYEAFDAAEHNHFGRSKDPVNEFTDPMIDKFFDKNGGGQTASNHPNSSPISS